MSVNRGFLQPEIKAIGLGNDQWAEVPMLDGHDTIIHVLRAGLAATDPLFHCTSIYVALVGTVHHLFETALAFSLEQRAIIADYPADANFLHRQYVLEHPV